MGASRSHTWFSDSDGDATADYGWGMSGNGGLAVWINGVQQAVFENNSRLASTSQWGWSSTTSAGGTSDLIQTRAGAASLQYGAADVDTAPVAQTGRTQGALAGGTSNVAGANYTVIVSPGKGTGVGGSWILQTAPAGSTGTTVNAGVARITADGPGNVVVGSAALATNVTDGFLYIPTCAGTPSGTPTTYTGRIPMIYDTSANVFWFYASGWKQPKTPAGAAVVTWQ